MGDVYLTIQIKDKDYEVDGLNLINDVELLPYEAVLGCEKLIQTPDGKVKVKFPKNTSTGKKLRLKEMGLKGSNNSRGDLEVRVKIVIKDDISQEALELYEKLKKIDF